MKVRLLALTGKASSGSPKDHLRDCRIAVSWYGNIVDAVHLSYLGEHMRNSANSMMRGAASAKQ